MEVQEVSGADWTSAGAAGGAAAFLGVTSFGAGWGTVAVGVAFAASPITVIAVVGLAAYAGYQAAS